MTEYQKEELEGIIADSVRQTLLSLGISTNDPVDMQRDFSYLRELRTMSESIKKKSILTIVGAVILSVLALIAVGIKNYFLG